MPAPVAPEWTHQAIRHGLAGFLADALSTQKAKVPVDLATAARAQFAAGLRHQRLTLTVLDALSKQGIRPTLLKGYGLASRLYAQPLLRPASDVDVLVPPPEFGVAQRALLGLGLQLQHNPGLADAHEEHHHEAYAGAPGLVELHHRLFVGFGRSGFDDQGIVSRRVEAHLNGREVYFLEPEDELMYLCIHAANHSFLRLSWLLDVKCFLVAYPSLNWGVMASRARQVNMQRALTVALRLAQRLLDARLPPEANAELRPSYRSHLDEFVFSEARVISAQWSEARVPAFLLHLFLTDTSAQVARHVFDGALRASRRARSGP